VHVEPFILAIVEDEATARPEIRQAWIDETYFSTDLLGDPKIA